MTSRTWSDRCGWCGHARSQHPGDGSTCAACQCPGFRAAAPLEECAVRAVVEAARAWRVATRALDERGARIRAGEIRSGEPGGIRLHERLGAALERLAEAVDALEGREAAGE